MQKACPGTKPGQVVFYLKSALRNRDFPFDDEINAVMKEKSNFFRFTPCV